MDKYPNTGIDGHPDNSAFLAAYKEALDEFGSADHFDPIALADSVLGPKPPPSPAEQLAATMICIGFLLEQAIMQGATPRQLQECVEKVCRQNLPFFKPGGDNYEEIMLALDGAIRRRDGYSFRRRRMQQGGNAQ